MTAASSVAGWLRRNRIPLAIGIALTAAIAAARGGSGDAIVLWLAVALVTWVVRRWRAAAARRTADDEANGPRLVRVAAPDRREPGPLLLAAGVLLGVGLIVSRHRWWALADFVVVGAVCFAFFGVLLIRTARKITRTQNKTEVRPRVRGKTRWWVRALSWMPIVGLCVWIAVVDRTFGVLGGVCLGVGLARVAQLRYLARWEQTNGATLYWRPRVRWRTNIDDYVALVEDHGSAGTGRAGVDR